MAGGKGEGGELGLEGERLGAVVRLAPSTGGRGTSLCTSNTASLSRPLISRMPAFERWTPSFFNSQCLFKKVSQVLLYITDSLAQSSFNAWFTSLALCMYHLSFFICGTMPFIMILSVFFFISETRFLYFDKMLLVDSLLSYTSFVPTCASRQESCGM